MDTIKVGFVCNAEIALQAVALPQINTVFNTQDGYEALQFQRVKNADVIVTELLIPQMDGFALVEQLASENPKTNIIVLTELSSHAFMEKAYKVGACQYLIKPSDVNALLVAIKYAVSRKASIAAPKVDKSLDERIANIFISVGIPAHIKGYQFLREGIKLAVDSPAIINSITKRLYPSIASIYDTTPSKVERAIRHAIEVAWNRGKIENINSLFGIKVYTANEKPTNGEFIALLADKMLLECSY